MSLAIVNSGATGETPVMTPVAISIIIPFYEEADNVEPLFSHLFAVVRGLDKSCEIIAVNDGSRDRTLERLKSQTVSNPELTVIDLRRNSGQTAAIMAGLDHARGDIIVTLDGDLQNDPDDIVVLLEKLAEGYDVAAGWRKDRKDAPIRRNFLSRVANRIISFVSKVPLNDYGCTLKAYRREVLSGMRLYGEMHRFIPIYASWMGARVVEVPVRHHPRTAGLSKYGLERVVKVVLDLMVVKFLDRYLVKPIYVFGGFGFLSFLLAMLSFLYMIFLKIAEDISMISTPLPVFTAMCILIGVLSILLGLVAEVVVRTYFESQDRKSYSVRQIIRGSGK